MTEHQEPAVAAGTDLPLRCIHILDVACFIASIAFIAAPAAPTVHGDRGSVDVEEMAVLTAAGALR
jgi:hypothetical protein